MTDLRGLAGVLRGLPPLHAVKFPPSYDLPTCTFHRKLVSAEVVSARFRIEYGDFLKGLACVDHFALVVTDDPKALSNLASLQAEIGKKNPKPMMSLDLVLVELGLRSRELAVDPGGALRRWAEREGLSDSVQGSEPYYLGLAAIVTRQVAAASGRALAAARTRQEILSVLFADAVASLSGDAAVGRALAEGDFRGASRTAAEALRTCATPALLKRHLQSAIERKPSGI